MTQNEHFYVICCPPEVDGDVISGQNVKIIEEYVVQFLKMLALVISVYSKQIIS